jgi:hypothetical protein
VFAFAHDERADAIVLGGTFRGAHQHRNARKR